LDEQCAYVSTSFKDDTAFIETDEEKHVFEDPQVGPEAEDEEEMEDSEFFNL